MKQLCLLIGTAVLGILLVSCSAQKRVWYLQDAQPFTPEQIAENGQIRIKPLDRLTIVVNSKDPELAVPFNSATSYNSLTGTNISGAANSQALQMRTVDENGMLEMPVIGKIECKGKTRLDRLCSATRRGLKAHLRFAEGCREEYPGTVSESDT